MVRGRPLRYCPLSRKAFSPQHSKLCFLQHASASAAKNACPCRGRNLAPKSQIAREGHNGGKTADGEFSPFNDSKHERTATASEKKERRADTQVRARFPPRDRQSRCRAARPVPHPLRTVRPFVQVEVHRPPRVSSATASGSYAPTGARWSMWPSSPPCTSSTAPSG